MCSNLEVRWLLLALVLLSTTAAIPLHTEDETSEEIDDPGSPDLLQQRYHKPSDDLQPQLSYPGALSGSAGLDLRSGYVGPFASEAYAAVSNGDLEVKDGGYSVENPSAAGTYSQPQALTFTQTPVGYGGSGAASYDNHKYEEKPAKYEFLYRVKDHEYKQVHQQQHGHSADGFDNNDYGHSEARDGDRTWGRYFVKLPDGRVQTVRYWADHSGYHAEVLFQGKAHHPAPTVTQHKYDLGGDLQGYGSSRGGSKITLVPSYAALGSEHVDTRSDEEEEENEEQARAR